MEQPQDLIGEPPANNYFFEFYKKALAYTHAPELMLKYLRKV